MWSTKVRERFPPTLASREMSNGLNRTTWRTGDRLTFPAVCLVPEAPSVMDAGGPQSWLWFSRARTLSRSLPLSEHLRLRP